MTDANGKADLKELVRANLEAAKENDAFGRTGSLEGATALEIAEDMVAYASDVEDRDPAELVPLIEAWLKEKGI